MLELVSQKSSNHWFQHLANFTKSFSTDRLTADVWGDITPFLLRIRTSSLNKICSWYLGLQKLFRSVTNWSHGLAVASTWKLGIRLGFGLSERTESRRQWPTPVAVTMAMVMTYHRRRRRLLRSSLLSSWGAKGQWRKLCAEHRLWPPTSTRGRAKST